MNFLHRLPLLAVFMVLLSCNNKTYKEMPLKEVEDFYNYMKEKGVNTDTTMLYGYFFTNETKKPLEAAAEELKKKNFQFVKIYQSDDKIYWLHVERMAMMLEMLIQPKQLKQTAMLFSKIFQ